MYAIYIENFINDSTNDCDCTYYNFSRMGISDIKDIFENVWNIGKVKDIDDIETQSADKSTPTKHGVIVYIESNDLYNGSSSIIDLLEQGECSKRRFYIYGDDIENGSGPYLEVELCTPDMLYAMSSTSNY
jgi:hypothetical protein